MTAHPILAIDEGTTGVGAFVFDADGRQRARAEEDFPQHFPRPGWVEHDPEDIWNATQRVVKEALGKANLSADDLTCIGITNQRETVVVWDQRTGRPVMNAIVWQDRRTADIVEALAADGWADTVRQRTGLVLDAYFSGPKVQWILDHVEGARDEADAGHLRAGTIDTWLMWKLTGGREHVTDPTNACRTLLYDIDRGAWDGELCEAMRVPATMLPDVRDTSGHISTTAADAFGAEVPITGVAGDQQAALFGQMCHTPGDAKNTYGTGSFLLMNTGSERKTSERLLASIAWRMDGSTTYCLEGSVFVTGAAIQWLRDGLGLIEDAAETEAIASSVEDTGGVHFVPALTGLGAPHWDMHARGTISGLTRGTTRAHIVRATLESIAFQMRDVAAAMEEDSGVPLHTLRVDGGGSMNGWMMQFQSDILGAPVERPRVSETTALGAAYFAGLGAGVWDGVDELAKLWELDARWEPGMSEGARVDALAAWELAVAATRAHAAASRTG